MEWQQHLESLGVVRADVADKPLTQSPIVDKPYGSSWCSATTTTSNWSSSPTRCAEGSPGGIARYSRAIGDSGRMALDVVCVMHGGFPVPDWLQAVPERGRLYLTLNDAREHEYAGVPSGSILTTNPEPRGFAENVNAGLRRAFDDDGRSVVVVVNFDMELAAASLATLAGVVADDSRLGLAAARLSSDDGSPIFSAGTTPTPLREFLRAAGLRSGALFEWQRAVIRRTPGWSARNAVPETGVRVLEPGEYLPWTCVALRREAWSAVGELDERFPMYGEDIDWSLRCHQSGWTLGLADCGRVVHFERATRSPRSDALYEYSHRELHRKWGWDSNLRWHRRGLQLRRRWPLRTLAPDMDWAVLAGLDQPDS